MTRSDKTNPDPGRRLKHLKPGTFRPPERSVEDGPTRDDRGVLWFHDGEGWSPDLEDPAARGVLLQVVRDAWLEPLLYAAWDAYHRCWLVACDGTHTEHWERVIARGFVTEVDALIAALEAAP